MNINKLDFFIKDKKTDIQKNKITNIIKERLCHHKVRFLSLLINYLNKNIKNYLEIGVHNGTSMSYVLQSDCKVNNCYGIDLFEDTFYSDNLDKNRIYNNLQKLNKNKSNIFLIKGDSTDKNIIKLFENIKLDIIFIDGNHTYEGVKKDFFNYYTFLSNNGIMIFDDFNEAPTNRGVYKFINELLKIEHKYFKGNYKFIDNEHPYKFKKGIIMFYK